MLKLCVFGSGAGTNFEALIQARDDTYEVTAAFADRKCRFLEVARNHAIPALYLSFLNFFSDNQVSDKRCPKTRAAYDQKIVELISPYPIDMIVLAGYMRILSPTFIRSFEGTIINVHPADLAALDQNGKRKYIGADAVKDALEAGEMKTRSTVIQIDEKVDHGEIVTFGPWVEYTQGYPLTDDKIKNHQEKQKKESDWPALIEAVRSFSKKGKEACVEY